MFLLSCSWICRKFVFDEDEQFTTMQKYRVVQSYIMSVTAYCHMDATSLCGYESLKTRLSFFLLDISPNQTVRTKNLNTTKRCLSQHLIVQQLAVSTKFLFTAFSAYFESTNKILQFQTSKKKKNKQCLDTLYDFFPSLDDYFDQLQRSLCR